MKSNGKLEWITSSFMCGPDAGCVEVARSGDGISVRDRSHSAAIELSMNEWTEFVDCVLGRAVPSTNAAITIVRDGADTVVASRGAEVTLHYDRSEWEAFIAGAAAGEFNFSTDKAGVA